MNEITSCKYCLEAGICTGVCSDASELSTGAYYAGYDAGYEKGKSEAVADYEKRLRDEFAMAAMREFIARAKGVFKISDVAIDSYTMSDLMLEARK